MSAKGSIKREANGTYSFIVDLGRKPDGRRNQVRRRGFKTRKEADAALTQLKAEFQSGGFVEPTKVTLADFCYRWLETTKLNFSPKTYERYVQMVRNHIVPTLGGIPLQKLSPLDIQLAYTALLKEGRADGCGGLSPKTIRNINGVLSTALKSAYDWRLIPQVPTTGVKLPKVERKEMAILTKVQCGELLGTLEGRVLHPIVFLALTTGMRRGELLALKWSNVDWEGSSVHVIQSVEQTKAGKRLKDVKTKHGRRRISLPPLTIQMLRDHHLKQAEQLFKLGIRQENDGFVFANYDGKVRDPLNVSTMFREHMQKCDLPRVRFHDLRHTHISQLLADGHPPLNVSRRAGHANISITLDTYGHLIPDQEASMIDEFGNGFSAAIEQATNKRD